MTPRSPFPAPIRQLPQVWANPIDYEYDFRRYRDIRLESFQNHPQAYVTKYEDALEFPDNQWEHRLKDPMAKHFVAQVTDTSEWLGLVTIMGPYPPKDGVLRANVDPWSKAPGQLEEGETSWFELNFHINSVYTTPTVRGLGFGQRLIEASMDYGTQLAQKWASQRAHFSVLVDSENAAAKRLYEKCGFVQTGQEDISYAGVPGPERPIDQISYRDNPNSSQYRPKRVAFRMEKHVYWTRSNYEPAYLPSS